MKFTHFLLAASVPLALAKDKQHFDDSKSKAPSCGAPFCGRSVAEVHGIMDMLKERKIKTKANAEISPTANGAEGKRE